MRSVPESNVYARSLVWRMFREAADEDYLVARWAAHAKLPFQFYWSAQQSLEKYLKGLLLMNGVNIKNYGHNLVNLLSDARTVADDLIPYVLCPPSYFPRRATLRWNEFEPTDSFIARFNDLGDTGNRYRHYSLTFYGGDLHHYDEICFRLRRLVFPLEMKFSSSERSYRQVLSEEPNYQPHSDFPFLNQKSGEELEECKKALQWRNFSYFEDLAKKNKKINSGIFSSNSQIFLSSERGVEGKEAIKWLIENARFTKSDLKQLQELLHKEVDS